MTQRRAQPSIDGENELSSDLAVDPRISEGSLELSAVAAAAKAAASGARSTDSTRVNWRGVLFGASPREVLARLMAGDPLRLRERVAESLERQCVLLDGDRVFLRAAARIARFAQRYRGQPDFEPWLRGQIDDAVLDLLEEDESAAASGKLSTDEGLAAIARPLGLDPARMRVVCATFNRMHADERRVFSLLVLHNRSLDDVVKQTGGAATSVARTARRVLETLMQTARGGQA